MDKKTRKRKDAKDIKEHCRFRIKSGVQDCLYNLKANGLIKSVSEFVSDSLYKAISRIK